MTHITVKTDGPLVVQLPVRIETPDGRFAVFRSINPSHFSHNLLHVVRLHEDGQLEYLKGKEVDVDYYICAIAIALMPEPNSSAAKVWAMYE